MGFFSLFRKKEKPTKLEPESRVIVGFDSDRIWCVWPGEPENDETPFDWISLQ